MERIHQMATIAKVEQISNNSIDSSTQASKTRPTPQLANSHSFQRLQLGSNTSTKLQIYHQVRRVNRLITMALQHSKYSVARSGQ